MQAADLAASLPRPDVIVCSPLRRAQQTADAWGSPFEVDERWIEVDYGRFDEQPIDQLSAADEARWHLEPDFSPGGMETLASLSTRVTEACEELRARAQTSVVVVVTHVGPIKAALGWALGVGPAVGQRMFVEDAGVSRVDLDGGRPIVRWFNRFGDQPGQ